MMFCITIPYNLPLYSRNSSQNAIPEFKPKTFDWGHGGAGGPVAPRQSSISGFSGHGFEPAFGVQAAGLPGQGYGAAAGRLPLSRDPGYIAGGGLALSRGDLGYGGPGVTMGHGSRDSSLVEEAGWSPHSRGEILVYSHPCVVFYIYSKVVHKNSLAFFISAGKLCLPKQEYEKCVLWET
jgi:hypothetical protein